MLRPFMRGTLWMGLGLGALAVVRGYLREEDLRIIIFLGLGWFCTPVLMALVFALPTYAYAYLRAPALEPGGVIALDTLQRKRHVPWDEIYEAKTVSLGGFPEVAIAIRGSYWRVRVPLYLRQRSKFEGLVQSYAGAEHPLSQAVRSEP